jgi:hypothetical protein
MNLFKTKLALLAICSAMMLPTAVSAATTSDHDAAAPAVTNAPADILHTPVAQTNVHGIWVPGIFINIDNARVAYVPDTGLIVIDKDMLLPKGGNYLN